MQKRPTLGERKQAARESVAWPLLMLFIVLFVGGGSVLLIQILTKVGIGLDRTIGSPVEVMLGLVCMLLVLVFLFYVACVVWTLFASLFFTKAEVAKIVLYGPTTRFDRWLFDRLYPVDSRSG